MNKTLMLLCLLAASTAALAQSPAGGKVTVEGEVYTVVDSDPQFPGGFDAMLQYVATNVRYPKEAIEKKVEGRVMVTFVVEADGSIANIRVLQGIGGGCDEEAVRVVASMPRWKPGERGGEKVRVQFSLPINFQLNNDNQQ